jgi:hypothetical protein
LWFNAEHVDGADCRTYHTNRCKMFAAVPGATITVLNIQACGQALAAESCDQFRSSGYPPECTVSPGTRADGEPCISDAQCAGISCTWTANAACGACSHSSPVGSTCTVDGDCTSDAWCDGASKTCIAYLLQGASCTGTNATCAWYLACTNGVCQPPAGYGAPCDQTAENCDWVQGLYCSSTATCQPVTLAAVGQPCGTVQGAANYVECGVGASCETTSTGTSLCMAFAPEGSPCDPARQYPCAGLSHCANNVCTSYDAVSCH